MRKHEGGFTLVELMFVMALTTILLTLGAFAVRNYWLVRSLTGGQREVVGQLRAVQAKVMAESNPLIYGVGFREGTNQWQIVRYNSNPPVSCVGDGTRRFDAGVVISDVEFQGVVGGQDVTAAAAFCRSQTGFNVPNDGWAFFLPRGMATPGTITLRQPNLDRTEGIEVTGLSGRVVET